MTQKLLVYTLHKCASMFVYEFLRELSALAGLRHVSVNDPRYFSTIRGGGYYRPLFDEGDIFGPIRVYEPPAPDANLFIHLRDPRDLLVSLYFSFCYSHGRLSAGAARLDMAPFPFDAEQRALWLERGADAFVLACAPFYAERFADYFSLADQYPVTILRYEDMIADLAAWMRPILQACGHGDLESPLLTRFTSAFDVGEENVRSHKRHVVPGDHAQKLRPETIAALNEAFQPVLERLGYPVGQEIEKPGVASRPSPSFD